MSWLKKRTKLCVGTFTVLLIIFWFLHFVMILHDHEIAMESLIWEDKYEEAINSIHTDELRTSTIILLQQSQVQTEKQLERLRSIDTGWARWKNATNACNDIRIVAALPNDVPPKDDFKLIGSLPMLPAAWAKIGSNKTSVSSPYHHLVCSLLALLSSSQSSQRYPSLKWIVLANDHTFLIPQNLAKHLNAMDSDGLLYTGNQLALPFHKKILSFASGGAGAVLSHATAKLILSAWLLITDEDILLSMLDGYASANSAHHENTPKVHWPQHSRDGDEKSMCTTLLNYLTCHPVHGSSVAACEVIIDMTPTAHADMGCYLYALRQWLDRTSILPFINERLTNIMQVRLVLSSKVRVTVGIPQKALGDTKRMHKRRSAFNLTLFAQGEREEVVTVSAAQLRKECSAPDKWSKTNPGIILISCLSTLFNVRFTPSLSDSVMRQRHPAIASQPTDTVRAAELFNVYGTLRTIFGEYDEWYAEAKQLISSSVGNSTAADAQRVQLKPPTLARDVISFHYVSTVESQLLYRILNAQLQTEQNSHSTHDKVNNQQSSVHGESVAHTTTNDSVLFPALCFSEDGTSAYGDKTSSGGGGGEKQTCLSVRDILDMWPRAGEQVGHYSRPLAKGAAGLKQAVSLHAYLSQVTIEQKRPGC